MKYIVYIQADRYFTAYGWKGCCRKTFKTKAEAEKYETFYKVIESEIYHTKIVEK